MIDDNNYDSYYLKGTETTTTKPISPINKNGGQKESVDKKTLEVDEKQYKRDIAYSRYIGHVKEQD
jgi:hypothetical protein